ncbi:MAG TPA: DinB family protein, partial [Steroidobacteraceae bacterium]|nr:DinB family protein [Steroidobacteraceae bacterium]
MSALRNVRLLSRYSAWANSLLYLAMGELPEAELTKPRQILFGNLIRTLNHVYTIDLVFQAHLEGREHGFKTRMPDVSVSLPELQAAQAALDGWYIRYAEEMS